ncbi:DUF3375 domain-containing protein [Dyadobacter sp. 3J3]|uniref:DUF3375 domain-containing protein n=1 Tax=Dyadobacter sp. 3J3 TaxID=2606600 RepID=UPI00190FA8AA|nr:DUF3375 domain-containing protein [Dyadobacter sp. 3J3]
MIDSLKIAEILNSSPSVELLRLKNNGVVIVFLVNTFSDLQTAISSEQIHAKLCDYLEAAHMEIDDEDEISFVDSYEIKAKKYIQNWTNKGFLTNYQDQTGNIFYELSSHSSKTLDWLSSLKKEEYVGTESKFKNIFSQLKELVEFTNEDKERRIELLEEKKQEIERQILQIKTGQDIKIFENFEIIPRFNQLNQSAKELLTDFKEVEDNFKIITKEIYQRHSEGTLTKNHILQFTFDALDELKESSQGKSFYAFWSFLLTPSLQQEWDTLTKELYQTLQEKEIAVTDFFLKGMKRNLHFSGQRVYKANDKMAEKLGRIIRANETSQAEATKSILLEIKRLLIASSKLKIRPGVSLELDTGVEINIPFERKLTFEQEQEQNYTQKPLPADSDLTQASNLGKLFHLAAIDKELLRARIREVLTDQSQVTILDVVDHFGGIKKGLPELFAYIGIAKEFKHMINAEKTQRVTFDHHNQKSILIPEIIVTR